MIGQTASAVHLGVRSRDHDQGLTRDTSLGPHWLLAPFMRLLAHAVLALQRSSPGSSS